MKLKGQLQWTDYLGSQLLHMQPGGLVRIMLYGIVFAVGCGFVGWLSLFAIGQIEFPFGFVLPVFFLIAFFALYRYVILPNRIKKIFIQQRELSLPFEMEITDTGIVVSNELGNGIRPWVNFTKWKENKDLLILYHSDVMYSVLPKRMFSDSQQIDSIKSYLEKNKVSVAQNRSMAISCVMFMILFLIIATMLYIGFSSSINQ